MSSEVYNILFSRSKYIERDRSIAIIRLEEDCVHAVGQPVMVRYYTDDSQTEIDAVVAIGVKNGKGKDCFKVISLGGLFLVRNVSEILPDVSNLLHGEIYICPNEEGIWCFVYESGGVRQLDPITGGPFIFSSIEDKYRWFFRDGKVKREDDFNTTEEFEKVISTYDEKIQNTLNELDKIGNLALKNNTKTFPINVSFYDDNNQGGVHKVYQTGQRTGVNFNIRVSMLEVDLETGDVETLDVTKDCTYVLNEEKIVLTEENLYTVENLSKTTDYTLQVQYIDPITKVIKNGTAYYTVEFGYPIRYGKAPKDWELTESNVKSLSNSIIGNENTVIEIKENLNDERIVIASPKIYGNFLLASDKLTKINCISDYNIQNCSIDGVDYLVFIKSLPIYYENFNQIFSYSDNVNVSNSGTSNTSTISSSDLESLRQEILGGASNDYNTLYKIEKKIKGISTREGIVAGNGITITDNEDGSSTISVNSDNSSISVNKGDNTISVDTVDGGYY